MNNLKRLISMLLCMALMFTSVSVFAEEAATEETVIATEETVAEETTEATEDAATEEVAEIAEEEEPAEEVEPIEIDWDRIGLLETLGIIDEVDEAKAQEFLTAQISRAEFAVALVKFANMDNVVGGENSFKDVIKDSFEEPYINTAVKAGLIAPVSEGYYYPKYPISYQDAAQAFVMTLGYTPMANVNDSWIIQARKLGLMSGVDTGAAFTRAQAYRMFFNALHADIMDVVGIEGTIANFDVREGVDPLYKFFNIYHEEGIITAAGGVELGTGRTTTAAEYIKHNGKLYKYGAHDLNKYLGRNAVVYRDTNGNAVYVLNSRNEELNLPATEIGGYSNYTYTYGADDETAKIAIPPYVILNNAEYMGEYVESVMRPDAGNVTLVDNNRDGIYDVVFIRAYTDYYVKAMIANSYKVIAEFVKDENRDNDNNPATNPTSPEIILDPNTNDVQIYSESGQLIDLSEIKVGNVISVMESGNRKQVYVSTASVTGAIGQISKAYTGEAIWTIDGTDYMLSEALEAELAKTAPAIKDAEIGQTYKFLLNIYGEIVYYEEAKAATGDDKFYAVITAAKLEGLDNKVSIKAFAKEFGGFESLTLPKRIILNGTNATPVKVFEALNRDGIDGHRAPTGTIYPQPVKIKVNENNEITYLAQASVAEYYSAMDQWGDSAIGSCALEPITEPSSFPNYEAEFQLYMGDPTGGGNQRAYRDIIDQAVVPGAKATIAKHPYSVQAAGVGGRTLYRALKPTANVSVYQVPMYLDVTQPAKIGKIAPEKEEFFAMASIPRAAGFKMMAYKEGADSMACSFCLNIVSADAAKTVGTDFSIRLVTEITEEYINEEKVTVVNTHAGKFYIKQGTIDINALPFYSYTEQLMNNPRTGEATYKVNPGDLINIRVDTLNYAQAIEPVFDSTNGYFLGDYETTTSNTPPSKYYNSGNNPFCYGTREGDNKHKIEWMFLTKVDNVNGAVEGRSYKVATRVAVPGKAGHTVPATLNETKIFSMIPGSCVYVSKDRNGVITTRNAVGSDYVSTEDAPNEAAVLLLSQSYVKLIGTSFLYPAELTQNWPKTAAELGM